MATFALFPSDDPVQAHRIRRYLIAAGTSVLVWVLLFLLYWEGYLRQTGLVHATGWMLFFFVLFYALFRSGLNLKVRDPSLTVEMMESAIVVLTWAMYYASPEGRGVIVLLLPFAFLFGLLRIGTRDMLGVAGFAFICYGAMTLLLVHNQPATLDLRITLLHWVVLTAVFVWFAFMGGYISRMHKTLALSKTDLEQALRAIRETRRMPGTIRSADAPRYLIICSSAVSGSAPSSMARL